MSQLTYRTAVYRGAYATVFVAAYLLLAAFLLSGGDSVSESSTGVWGLMLGMALAGTAGAIAGPALHRRLFKSRAARRAAHKPGKHSHHHHSHE
ncbi:MAG: hypothetical protein PHS32_14040 [Rhodoferax sp.]|uniref:hypothetical protein n=1 Tax=Rhodoferax sp. TaxID=50421 RepID=UPI0026191468|nr:hypothetical protein [Rhodoferax sp.]MDD5334850.1 hypothetical protein [Rhodoferax sp.]